MTGTEHRAQIRCRMVSASACPRRVRAASMRSSIPLYNYHTLSLALYPSLFCAHFNFWIKNKDKDKDSVGAIDLNVRVGSLYEKTIL